MCVYIYIKKKKKKERRGAYLLEFYRNVLKERKNEKPCFYLEEFIMKREENGFVKINFYFCHEKVQSTNIKRLSL